MHQRMAATIDETVGAIGRIQAAGRGDAQERPRWPMIVLRIGNASGSHGCD
jgi:phosphoketolase